MDNGLRLQARLEAEAQRTLEADKYGIANAVARAAQKEKNWEKSLALERILREMTTLPSQQFRV